MNGDKNKKNNDVEKIGDEKMESMLKNPKALFLVLVSMYGLVAFLNPERYPILGVILNETAYAKYGQYDSLVGLGMMLIGIYFLFSRKW